MDLKTEIYEYDGLKVNYSIKKNSESGPVYLLLHGLLSDSSAWYPFIDDQVVDNTNSSFILVDLPGFGKSSELENYSFEYYSHLLNEITSFLLKKYFRKHNLIVVGSSMGAMVALDFVRIADVPIDGCIMISPVNPISTDSKLLRIIRKITPMISGHKSLERFIMAVFRINIIHKMGWKMNSPEMNWNTYRSMTRSGRVETSPSALIRMFKCILEYDTVDVLSKLDKDLSLLVISGGKDKFVYEDDGLTDDLSKNSILKLDYEIIKDGGHVLIYENPLELKQVISKYVNSVLKQ